MLNTLKSHKNIIVFIAIVVISIASYLWFIQQPIFHGFIEWSQQNLLLYFVILTLLKIIGIVWPPLPGGLLTAASIPIIGWWPAYLADATGGLIGSVIAYYIGKHYGWEFLESMFSKEIVDKIQKVKIHKHREIEAVFVLKVFYGSVGEVISYGSGLIGIHFKNFMLGTFLWMLLQIPMFYAFNNVLNGDHVVLGAIFLTIAIFLFYKFKGRYFE